MKLTSFYSEDELSSIRVSSVDETVNEIKGLFFNEQLVEEKILLEIYSSNSGNVSDVDELRLDFDRIYSKKQIMKKCLFGRFKFVDSSEYQKDYAVKTILAIKSEERYLNATFKDFHVLLPRNSFFKKSGEPLLFASLKNNNFYLLNDFQAEVSKSDKSVFSRFGTWMRKKISFRTSSR
mgnify:CR=1 FL=1